MNTHDAGNEQKKLQELMKNAKGVIFDIDGVLEYRGQVFEGARETIKLLKEKGYQVRFLTNSTLKSHQSCAIKLQQKGFPIEIEECITASYATALYLRQIQPKSCWVMLEREGKDEFQEFVHDEENPEYLVIGDNRSRFNFSTLNKALRHLLNGTKLIGMTSELVDGSLGEIELNVGSWVGMLERAARITATYIGKPSKYAFELTLATMKGITATQVIMVGDRISSDIKGAKPLGMKTVLVKTGEFQERDLSTLEERWYPDLVVDSIGTWYQQLLEVL